MAEDIIKLSGQSKASKPDAGGAVIRNVPVFGIVKNNIDPTRSGRLQVYISDLGGEDANDPKNWITVSFMTPYYGFVSSTSSNTGSGDFATNSASYGVWNSPPDIGSTVICMFINGDPNYGFYIGCVPKAEALQMVPAIGSVSNVTLNSNEAQSYGGVSKLPVTNLNTNNEALKNSSNFLDEPKPVHSYQASILFKQGLIRDDIRGTISTSAQRESPSRVGWGVSSPGRPIYAGGYNDDTIAQAADLGSDKEGMKVVSRRGGHSIVLDDGDLVGRDQLIRLRSAAGHQILMSDDGQTIFIIHSNGQSWIEMGKEGTIDLFSTNSFNVRTQGDINFHADNNINLHAKNKLNIKASDIYVQSEKSTKHKIGSEYNVETAGNYTHKITGSSSVHSNGETSMLSNGTFYVNGSRINLNTGSGSVPSAVPLLQDKAHTDTLFDSIKGYIAAPGLLKSITSRTPAHAPWTNANQGVNLETTNNASSILPTEPSTSVQRLNNNAISSPTVSTSAASISTVPPVTAIGNNLSAQDTGSLVSAVATNAALGPAATASVQGFGKINSVAAIGTFAQTTTQIENSGFLKPGASVLVDSLVKSGKSIPAAMTKNMFTGKNGISELASFVNNQPAQIAGVVSNLQQSQAALTSSGVITGKESPVSVAGVIMSGATAGIDNTIKAIKNIGNLTSNLPSPSIGIPGVTNMVNNAINSGNFAVNIAQSTTSGLSSIMNTILPVAGLVAGAKMNNRGATAAAFATIVASLGSLPKGPANLKNISEQTFGSAITKANTSSESLIATSDLLRRTGQILGGNIGRLTSAVSNSVLSVGKLNAANNPDQVIRGLTGVINSIGVIGSATGNKSLSKATNNVNSIIGISTQLNKNINSIANAKTLPQALGGIISLTSNVGRLGSITGNRDILKTTRMINSIASSGSQIFRANQVLSSSKNINTTLGAYGSILNAANRIAMSLGTNSKSSGLFGIPGGQLSVGSIVNKSLGSIGIPKNPALNSVITNAVTATINKIGFSAAVSSSNGTVTKQMSQNISALQTGGKNLTTIALNGTSLAEAGSINAAMSAVGFGGANAVKMPSVGVNTNDNNEVENRINNLINNPIVPNPTFKESSPTAITVLETYVNKNKQVDMLFSEIDTLTTQLDVAKQYYYDLESTLIPGDPSLTTALNQITVISQELESKLNDIEKIVNQA